MKANKKNKRFRRKISEIGLQDRQKRRQFERKTLLSMIQG